MYAEHSGHIMIPSLPSRLTDTNYCESRPRKRHVNTLNDYGDLGSFLCNDLLNEFVLNKASRQQQDYNPTTSDRLVKVSDTYEGRDGVDSEVVDSTVVNRSNLTEISSELDTPVIEESEDDMLLYGDINQPVSNIVINFDPLDESCTSSYQIPPSTPEGSEPHLQQIPSRRYKVFASIHFPILENGVMIYFIRSLLHT